MANDPSSSLTSLYTHLQTLIKKWVYDKTEVDNKLSNKLDKAQTSYKGKNVIVDSSSGNIAFEDKNNHTHSQYLTEHQSLANYVLNSSLGSVAFSNDYDDLDNKPTIPTIPTNVSAFNNDSGYLTAHQNISGKEDKSNKVTSLSSSSTDTQYPSAKAVFTNMTTVYNNMGNYVDGQISQLGMKLSTVATTGKYDDLKNKPTIPSASSTTPSADTTNGSVGAGTAWARSDHTHPKSSLYAESIHGHSIEDTDLFDVMDCINVNFNNLDNIYLLDTVFNISNYNGLPSKNSSVVNDILRNNAISQIGFSQIGLNKEFTPSTKYTFEFDYYTSASNRNGFSFGADPLLEDGVSINNSDTSLQVLVDTSNTLVQTFNGTSSPTNVYTHTSNLFTSGTHHIRIVRNNTNVTFYIDDVELYTYTNAKYNTIGLNKWSDGYNTISNIEIKIGG